MSRSHDPFPVFPCKSLLLSNFFLCAKKREEAAGGGEKKKKAKDFFFSLFFFCLRQSCGGEDYRLFPLKKGNCEKYRYVGPSFGQDWTKHKKTRSHGLPQEKYTECSVYFLFQDRFLCCPKWETQGYMWHLSHASAGGQKPPSPPVKIERKKNPSHTSPLHPQTNFPLTEKNKETFVLFVSHLLTNVSSFFPGKREKKVIGSRRLFFAQEILLRCC